MTLYARNDPNTPGAIDVRDFASEPPAGKGWLLVARNAAPTVTAAQVAVPSIVIASGVATETWSVRAKTQAEIDAADDVADAATLRSSAVIAALKAEIAGSSPLTAAQFRVLVARVLLFLVRRAIGGG